MAPPLIGSQMYFLPYFGLGVIFFDDTTTFQQHWIFGAGWL